MSSINDLVSNMIIRLGWDSKQDVNLKDTPERVEKWMQKGFCSQSEALELGKSQTKKWFPTKNDQMLIQGPIRVYSLCPHHLVVVEYDIWIGVMLKDKALGLSKYTRICEALCKYPWLQEDLTNQVADVLENGLDCKGIIVMIEGVHYCMKMRGVKQQEAMTTTSEIRGLFLSPPKGKTDPKGEFLSIVNMRKNDNR